MREQIIKKVEENKIVAIIRGLSADDAVKTARALSLGGIKLIEVTFDQSRPEAFSVTTESIKRIKAELGRTGSIPTVKGSRPPRRSGDNSKKNN